MNAITEINAAKFIHIVDILNDTDEQILEVDKNESIPEALEKEGRFFNSRIKEEMKKYYFTHTIEGFPKNKKLFYDYAHFTLEGSELVSERIGQLIK